MRENPAAEFWVIVRHLLQLLGNAHERVNAVPALLVFGLIVFQEVAPGELCGNEARQGQIWNNVRTSALQQRQQSSCPHTHSNPQCTQPSTQ